MSNLLVVEAVPVRVSNSGKIKRLKRSKNTLDPLSAAYGAYVAVDKDNKNRTRTKKRKATRKWKPAKTKNRRTTKKRAPKKKRTLKKSNTRKAPRKKRTKAKANSRKRPTKKKASRKNPTYRIFESQKHLGGTGWTQTNEVTAKSGAAAIRIHRASQQRRGNVPFRGTKFKAEKI